MAERIKPGGILTFKPHEKAPSFVKGTVVINLGKFKEFVNNNPSLLTDYNGEKQLKLQITEGKYGLELSVDTWKKGNNEPKDDLPF